MGGMGAIREHAMRSGYRRRPFRLASGRFWDIMGPCLLIAVFPLPWSIEDNGAAFLVILADGRCRLVSCRNKICKACAGFRVGGDAAPYTRTFSNEVDLVNARLRAGIFGDRDN
jgi:hypothetical protein